MDKKITPYPAPSEPPKKAPDAWTLYRNMFKEGDEVCIVTEMNKMDFGKLTTFPDGIELRFPDRRSRFYRHIDIRFMSHLGFPIKQLTGADGSDSIEKIDTVELQNALRKLLTKDIEDNNKQISTTFGDPFVIENCEAKIFNPGNSGSEFYDGDYQEVIVLKSKDDAQGMLWDIETIYDFEGYNP